MDNTQNHLITHHPCDGTSKLGRPHTSAHTIMLYVIDQALGSGVKRGAWHPPMVAECTPVDHSEIEADGVVVELGGTLGPQLPEIH